MADKRIDLEGEITDVHPRMKRDADGHIRKWLEVKLSTASFNPDELRELAQVQGATCLVGITEVQPELSMTGKV